jgi:OOP family OmpA-OmpF porin
VTLQAVANLGRIMSFETWTKSWFIRTCWFGLFFESEEYFSGTDRMGNLMLVLLVK